MYQTGQPYQNVDGPGWSPPYEFKVDFTTSKTIDIERDLEELALSLKEAFDKDMPAMINYSQSENMIINSPTTQQTVMRRFEFQAAISPMEIPYEELAKVNAKLDQIVKKFVEYRTITSMYFSAIAPVGPAYWEANRPASGPSNSPPGTSGNPRQHGFDPKPGLPI